ncbi:MULTISPECIES: hypothetical protein [Bacteroidales]|mgnify:FL=1|jgi:hypothetical protein|uniref:Transmembrane protein n=1 Tax=Bacteroides thetaiotaomicron TaxID=818 RepID=A0AAP3SFX2_BACT4|nr:MULTISPECIES: hypothetical protein [Bacteroidales]MCE9233528.1 hypothetical protein [Bacteroides ovatus]MDC2221698.1 hypothetical protein [Bacteroides thetaiotaomicron]MDC2227210.1 hypothetical protein [Bacteroides thetaiotaomicron]MDC2236121.1 hypothetical protein [Bacteroides thetaiotaomicron]
MENNIQVQKAADISSLAGVVIVSLSALTAYNIGEKFNHNILFDATIFIISLVMLILTFAIFRKVMAGLFTTTSSSTTNKQVQSECSQESSHQNANQDPVEEEQISDSLERYESILVEEQLKEVKRKRDTMIAIREHVVEKTSKYLSKENISTLFRNIECIAENRVNDCQPIHSTKEAKISSPSLRHLAWNIGERLGVSRRDRAIFIKSSFPYELRNADIEYLEANLRVNVPCDIPIDVPDKGDFHFHNNT